MVNKKQKNIILFVDKVLPVALESIRKYSKKTKEEFRVGVIGDSRKPRKKGFGAKPDILIKCDLSNPYKITKALLPYEDELLAITCRGDANIPKLASIVPYVPYLRTATRDSLLWSVDKIMMRRRFTAYDRKITPKYTIVSDIKKKKLEKIRKKVGFPLIVKPADLADSLLVSICYHEDELKDALRKMFKKIKRIYKENGRDIDPRVLVEQFMEGDMYSVDAYVNSRGRVYFCPFVRVKTGQSIGFDDFFGYQRMTPTTLKKPSILEAEAVSEKAVHALKLRSTTVHIELIRTEDGFKVIEVGPRIGGFRHKMYELSFGIDHSLNDVLIRIPRKPIIPKRIKGYTAVLNIFAKNEGILKHLRGIKRVQKLKSVHSLGLNKEIGDRCRFAKNGGTSVVNVTLFNKSRGNLLADIRRLEQTLVIKTQRGLLRKGHKLLQ